MPSATLSDLRRHAIAATLFPPATLEQAIEQLGFVQCDPIRAPARAQDLILRHRVIGYRAGDLERCYPDLRLEEDYLYAYGIVPETTWRLLHPRVAKRLGKTEQRVWELVCAQPKMHPRELEAHLGRRRQLNAWGSYSKATTRCLEALHYRGLLRVAGREKGVRLYQAARQQQERLAPEERLRKLVLLIARILAPVPDRSLRAALRHLARAAPSLTLRPSPAQRNDCCWRLSRCRDRSRPLSVARGRPAEPKPGAVGPFPRAIRSHRVGPLPLRTFMGLGLSL